MPQIRAVISGTSSSFRPRKQRFKQSRRFVDFQANIFHVIAAQFDVQPAFAFDASHRLDFDDAFSHFGRLLRRLDAIALFAKFGA